MDWPLVGEPLALDLINTRISPGDLMTTPTELTSWLELEAGRLPAPDRPLTTADVVAVAAIRTHIEDAVEAARQGTAPAPAELLALNDAARAAPAYRALSWDAGPEAVPRRVGDYRARLVAELAEAAIDLLTDPAVTKVRTCGGPGCRLLFLPAHPRRQWCSPAVCGNRVRVARHYVKSRKRQ